MKVAIIEDEILTAEDLADIIARIAPEAEVIALLHSVKEATEWLGKNVTDLIFCDIQLGDGLCFEIFKTVTIDSPVIFCTAYDTYALKAFKANGIDYILKPYDESDISNSLAKFNKLRNNVASANNSIERIIEVFEKRKKEKMGSVLVYRQDKILPVSINEIALFFIENEIVYLQTFDNKKYSINKTIDELEKTTSDDFFRVNRQIYLNRKAIKEVSQYFARKLSISLTIAFGSKVIVSKQKSTAFIEWLSTR
jgi:two-component system, LytTR family, response regulator LytT